jgi:hypothetical protein
VSAAILRAALHLTRLAVSRDIGRIIRFIAFTSSKFIIESAVCQALNLSQAKQAILAVKSIQNHLSNEISKKSLLIS